MGNKDLKYRIVPLCHMDGLTMEEISKPVSWLGLSQELFNFLESMAQLMILSVSRQDNTLLSIILNSYISTDSCFKQISPAKKRYTQYKSCAEMRHNNSANLFDSQV